MLSERIGKTLKEAQEELAALKVTRDTDKAKLKNKLAADLLACDKRYREQVKPIRALVRVLEAQAPEETKGEEK